MAIVKAMFLRVLSREDLKTLPLVDDIAKIQNLTQMTSSVDAFRTQTLKILKARISSIQKDMSSIYWQDCMKSWFFRPWNHSFTSLSTSLSK